MFYQEALPRFCFVSHVDSLLTVTDRHWQTLEATFEKAESANSLCLHGMGAFSCGVPIFVINAMWLLKSKWVPIFMGCLFCVGAYYPDFTVYALSSVFAQCGGLNSLGAELLRPVPMKARIWLYDCVQHK